MTRSRFVIALSLLVCIVIFIVFYPTAIPLDTRAALRKYRQLIPSPSSLCKQSTHFHCDDCTARNDVKHSASASEEHGEKSWSFDYERDAHNFGLDDAQCDAAFPGLFQDLRNSRKMQKARGNITRLQMEENLKEDGSIRAMVYDGELYVVDAINVDLDWFATRALATLHSLYRALIAVPDRRRLPNVEFTMTVHDSTLEVYRSNPNRPVWSFTRRAQDDQIWLMPDFGFWSWPEGSSGTPSEVIRRMSTVESGSRSQNIEDKIPKAIWRGVVDTLPQVRGDLLSVTHDKNWADVQAIEWWDPKNVQQVFVPIEDHCKYKYLIHTEGKSFSGRLKYLQNCQSVIIAHKLQWIQPANYLLVANGTQQNYVEVERDFSDLEQAIAKLEKEPQLARKIAENSVRTFKMQYLTPAAESCYWRKLISAWAEVSYEPDFYDGQGRFRGVPFENYALTRRVH